MKKSMLAMIVAGSAMISTTGLVALATAAPIEPNETAAQAHAEAELVAHLDRVLVGQLAQIKSRLQP